MDRKTTTSSYHSHDHEVDEAVKQYYTNSELTWEELIKDCGAYVMVENSARANEIFSRKYFKRIVEWKGYFLNAYVQAMSPLDFNPEHLININVRMMPSESLKNPDLFLSMDNTRYHKYAEVIRSLRTGDAIKFRAVLEALGNEWRTHHLHLDHLEKTEDFIPSDKKTVLFHGINFNITGHLKNEKIMEEMKLASEENTASEEKENEQSTNVPNNTNSTNTDLSSNQTENGYKHTNVTAINNSTDNAETNSTNNKTGE